jgi:hypothetical protein
MPQGGHYDCFAGLQLGMTGIFSRFVQFVVRRRRRF